MTLYFEALNPEFVAQIRAGGPDANGQPAERAVSNGQGTPCRSCLQNVPQGQIYLILAARPFPSAQPYAETGPIFLCADDCVPWSGPGLPPILTTSPDYLVKGYSEDHRIVYGTGRVTPSDEIENYASDLLMDPKIAFVDIRSARNNCFQTRTRRSG